MRRARCGRVLRPNSCLAASVGSLGLANGGSGFGSSVPLSCANASGAGPLKTAMADTRSRRRIAAHDCTIVAEILP